MFPLTGTKIKPKTLLDHLLRKSMIQDVLMKFIKDTIISTYLTRENEAYVLISTPCKPWCYTCELQNSFMREIYEQILPSSVSDLPSHSNCSTNGTWFKFVQWEWILGVLQKIWKRNVLYCTRAWENVEPKLLKCQAHVAQNEANVKIKGLPICVKYLSL